MSPTAPLRVLAFEAQAVSPAVYDTPPPRATSARNNGQRGAQGFTAEAQGWLTSFVQRWLQNRAETMVRDWLASRERALAVSREDAARLVGGISVEQLDRVIASGSLPTIRIGRRVVVRMADLEAWIAGLPAAGGGE